MSSQPKNTTTTQKVEVPEFQKPFLEDILNQAKSLYQSETPSYFPGQTIAPQSQYTQQGINQLASLGTNNPTLNAGTGLLGNTLGGQFLNSNPYLDQMYDSAADAVTRNYREAVRPGIDSAFARSGRLGSNAYNNQVDVGRDTLAKNLTQMAGNLYGSNYANERQNMMGALGMVPGMNQAQAFNAGLLGQAGGLQDQYAQNLINADIDRWNFNQNLPAAKLQQYAGLVGGTDLGKTVSTSKPVYTNPWAQGIGGLLSLGSLFGGGKGTLGGPLGGLL